MKVIPMSGSRNLASAPGSRMGVMLGWRGSPVEPVLTRFASELSPASGHEFFELLAEFVSECLGFDAVSVGEVSVEGGVHFVPLGEHPAHAGGDVTHDMIRAHCESVAAGEVTAKDRAAGDGYVDLPLVGCDGRVIGLLCGYGQRDVLDRRTSKMLFRMVADRAVAELERLRAQRELRRRDALFIGLIAEAHDLVGVIDDRGAFTALSPAIERVLGHRPIDCVGLAVTELVHPLDRASIEALLSIPASNGYSTEARLHHVSGAWVTMSVTLAEHEDQDRRRFKVLSARDLTDQRRLEDQLRQSQKTEIIGRLASGIAHDFGNILMVVGSHADIMRLRTTADDPRHADVDAIQAAVTRGADLARQLLAFTRHREFEVKRIDLTVCIEQLTTLLRRLVGSAIRIETSLSPEARYIAADATEIEQIVLNLTLNARDAMPNGGTITFTTTSIGDGPLPAAVAAAPAEFICFSVIDTGCGIADDVKPHIFEPQFTTKKDGAGSGMGLANVRDMVTRHGGCIEVDSADGTGATFRVYFRRSMPSARKT
jgi:PAS domain S-box-containing protein